jgi:hypothetical protein
VYKVQLVLKAHLALKVHRDRLAHKVQLGLLDLLVYQDFKGHHPQVLLDSKADKVM